MAQNTQANEEHEYILTNDPRFDDGEGVPKRPSIGEMLKAFVGMFIVPLPPTPKD